VYGRAKAYESIIKDEPITGPKIPESFNVLVKELQGLGLRVDLIEDQAVIDAENILVGDAADETKSAPIPADTEEAVKDEADELGAIDLGDSMTIETAEEFNDEKEA